MILHSVTWLVAEPVDEKTMLQVHDDHCDNHCNRNSQSSDAAEESDNQAQAAEELGDDCQIRKRRGNAELVAKSVRGERVIAATDFFGGIMSTALAEDELLTEARLPDLPAGTKSGFNEFNPMFKADVIGFDATTTIKRSEFGVGGGMPMVGDDVTIRITTEAKSPKPEDAKQ